jgi:hypothetical protein
MIDLLYHQICPTVHSKELQKVLMASDGKFLGDSQTFADLLPIERERHLTVWPSVIGKDRPAL